MTIPELLTTAAHKYGVPVDLVFAQARQESGTRQFRADGSIVRSSAGALGVMQLMPATARDLGVDPYDTAQNIDGGVRYLKQMYLMFGTWALALAAYNAGPGTMRKVLNNERGLPTETANYVKAITGAPLALSPSPPNFRGGQRQPTAPRPGQPSPRAPMPVNPKPKST